MKLKDILAPEEIIPNLVGTTKESVIEELAAIIAEVHPEQNKDEVTSRLLEREKLGSTGIELGVAIPHAKIGDLDRIIIAVGKSDQGIDFLAHDGKPSHLFFVLLAPENSTGEHLKTLARLSRLLKGDGIREGLMKAKTAGEIYNVIISGDSEPTC